jgi:hypothetical protein
MFRDIFRKFSVRGNLSCVEMGVYDRNVKGKVQYLVLITQILNQHYQVAIIRVLIVRNRGTPILRPGTSSFPAILLSVYLVFAGTTEYYT